MSAQQAKPHVDGDVQAIADDICEDKKDNEGGDSTPKDAGVSRSAKLHKSQKNQIRVRHRRGPRYQTQDLVRERSPPVVENVSGQQNVECNICKRQMTESRLANHIRLMHTLKGDDKNDENAKRFRCEFCGKSYAVKYTYEQHLKTHTEGRPKCPECGSTFASPFSLFRHRAKAHNIEHNYNMHSCDHCDKKFFSSSELANHKERHSNVRSHTCSVCEKSFTARGNLLIHMRTHAKEKPYKCDMCDSSFTHPYSLVSHRRIHTNELPFECSDCGKSFRSKHQLTSHKNVHSDKRPYGCDQCPKTFRSRTAYRMHLDHHKGIKRFSCQYCEKKFQCNANKTKHERRHVGIKKYKCSTCDKAFIERQEVKNHQRIHEKQEAKTTNTNNEVEKITVTPSDSDKAEHPGLSEVK